MQEDTEIEKIWEHAGFKCAVLFVGQRHRAGYVAVSEDHPAYEVSYDVIPVNVHGGITYAGSEIHEDVESERDLLWIGFDCGHLGDKVKGPTTIGESGHFWTKDEVVEETEKLAEQLEDMTWEDIVENKLSRMPDWFRNRVKIKQKGGA